MHSRLLACAVAMGAIVGLPAVAGAAPLVTPLTTPSGIHLYAPLQRGPLPSNADFTRIGQRFDVVVAPPSRMRKGAPIMRAANPSVQLFVYENGSHSTPHDPRFPASWYLYGSKGQRIETKGYANMWLMNPLSTARFTTGGHTYAGWRTYVAAQCMRDRPAGGTGCYLDSMGTATLTASRNVCGCVPIDPRTHRPFTDSSYLVASGGLAAYVHARTGRPVVVEGLGGGQSFYGKRNRILTRYVQGGQASQWLARKTWGPNVQMMIDTQKAGCAVLVSSDTATGGSLDRMRMFTLATYLMGDNGRAYLSFSGAGKMGWELWSSVYRTAIGAPAQTLPRVSDYIWRGVFRRVFSKGLVLVNPSTSTVKVKLGRTYHTLSGGSVSSVTLGPKEGDILLL